MLLTIAVMFLSRHSLVVSPDWLACSLARTLLAQPRRDDTNGSVSVVDSPGTWTFTPTNPNGTIDVADSGYVQFGWWLNMKGKKVENGFDVNTFASYSDVDAAILELDAGGQLGLTGSATYTGGAAGKWAIASTTEDTTEGGHFTATATLGVDFDADLNAGDNINDKAGVSFSGSISDFMTGATSRPSWNVTLTYGDEGAATTSLMPEISGTSEWTTGGAVDGMGADVDVARFVWR